MVWNFTLGMTYLLVPLYAHDLGMPGVEIGGLMALPVLIQIWFNLVGGVWSDRIGAKNTTLASCACTIGAAAVFASSASFAGLLGGQLLVVLARAGFWPASWSLASQMPGDRSRNMGRLNAITSAGQIAGFIATGMLIQGWGFRTGFWAMAGSGALAFAAALRISQRTERASGSAAGLFTTYRALLARRAVWFCIACAYMSALPFSLSASFYPILIVEQGLSSEATGWLLALRAAGSIGAGIFIARYVRNTRGRAAPITGALLTAASVGLIALRAETAWIGFWMVTVGLASGLITIYFQILISTISAAAERGAAMALGSLGWGVSNFSTPLVVGVLKDAFGIHTAFMLLGALLALCAVALAPLHRWAIGPADEDAAPKPVQ